MATLVGNFVETTLGAPASAGDLTITLSSIPSTFPVIGAGSTCRLVLEQGPRGAATAREIVIATSRTGSIVTVTRSQEGTTALDFVAGDRVALRTTAGTLDEVSARIGTASSDAATGFSDAATASFDAAIGSSDAATAQAALDSLEAAPFLVVAASGALSAETVFSAGSGVSRVDNGANASVVFSADPANYMPRSGFFRTRGSVFKRGNTYVINAVASGTSFAVYLGKADAAYTSVVVRWRRATAASGVSWAEIAIATGTATLGANATLTQRGWTSVAGDTAGGTNYTTTVALSGISAGDDIWGVFGISATTVGSLLGLGVISDLVASGFFQTATIQPQSISGTVFTIDSTNLLQFFTVQFT